MVNKYLALIGEEEPKTVVVHEGVSCNGCGTFPIRGIRYKCGECRDFDFCESCEKSMDHNPEHIFQKIKKPIDYSKSRPYHCRKQQSNDIRPHVRRDMRENRCNFFKNLFNNTFNPRVEEKDKKSNDENGYDFLVKELKEMYQLHELDDKIILEALKKANGDVEKAMTILFS